MGRRIQIGARAAACAAIAGALAMLTAQFAVRGGLARAGFVEENLPAQDLASPTATPSPSEAQSTTPPFSVIGGTPQDANAPAAAPSAAQSEPTPMAMPTELAPVEIGSVQPKGRISDDSLRPIIKRASSPALAASLRITEQAREDLAKGRTGDAIHALGRALSIDASNPYAYFYLGRAWFDRKNYAQAMTFFGRAEIGFSNDADWLGETFAFEGLTYEQQNDQQHALGAYQQALQSEPGNLMARVGYTRLAPAIQPAPPAQPESAATTEAVPPPPQSTPPPPPDQAAPPSAAY